MPSGRTLNERHLYKLAIVGGPGGAGSTGLSFRDLNEHHLTDGTVGGPGGAGSTGLISKD
jgi:hypothetical protein